MNKCIDQIVQLNVELEKLDAKLEYHEEKAHFDSNNHQYQRLLFEKKLKLETLCKLRIIYAEREAEYCQKASTIVPQDGFSATLVIPQSNVESAPLPIPAAASPRSSSPSPSHNTERITTQPAKLTPAIQIVSTAAPALTPLLPANGESGEAHGAKRSREELETAEQLPETKVHIPFPVIVDAKLVKEFKSENKESGDLREQEQGSNGATDSSSSQPSVPQPSVSSLDSSGSTNKKRRLPDLQVEAYNECKKEVGLIMKHFADKKVVLVSKVDGSDVTVEKYKAIKEQVAAGNQVANLIEGKMVSFVVAVDRRNGEFTEKGVFVPEYRVSSD